MSQYRYKARDQNGLLISATIDADNDTEAVLGVKSLGYHLISLRQGTLLGDDIRAVFQKLRKTYHLEYTFFSRQLSSLLKAGIDLITGLQSIADQTKNVFFKTTLMQIIEDIRKGSSFSEALSQHPSVFPPIYVSMIKAGESGGMLDEVLERLADLYDQERDVKARVKSAMTYPVILVAVSMVVLTFLLVNIVPKFVGIFNAYSQELPLPTRIILGASGFLNQHWLIVVFLAVALVYGFHQYRRTDQGRYAIDALILKVPLLGNMLTKVIVSRLCRTLGLLMRSGVLILEALSIIEQLIANRVVIRAIAAIRSSVIEGDTLSKPFKACGLFPATVTQMITIGEQSGRLEDMLLEISSFYDREVDHAIKNITASLEPILLLVMGVMVAFIALAVMLPIFDMVKVFRG